MKVNCIGAIMLVLVLALMHISQTAGAQRLSVSTDMLGYANFVTLNMEASYSLARHWSLNAGFRYNPFSFKSGDGRIQNRQRTYALGARFWPWHVYSGWWLGSKAQYQEYNSGGIVSQKTREGDRYGSGVSAGYTYMISRHLNLDFGLGVWAGLDKYVMYACPECGLTLGSGKTFFVLPSDVILALTYVF